MCKSPATHQALITCNMAWRDSSVIKFAGVEIAFISASVLAETIDRWKRGENTAIPGGNPWRRASENVTYYSRKIQAPAKARTHTLAGGRQRKQTCLTITPRITPCSVGLILDDILKLPAAIAMARTHFVHSLPRHFHYPSLLHHNPTQWRPSFNLELFRLDLVFPEVRWWRELRWWAGRLSEEVDMKLWMSPTDHCWLGSHISFSICMMAMGATFTFSRSKMILEYWTSSLLVTHSLQKVQDDPGILNSHTH